MKKIFFIILLVLVFAGCSTAKEDKNITGKEKLTIAVASDLHFLDNSRYSDYRGFRQALIKGDGKMTDHTDEILAQFIEEINELSVDLLVITGDLSFNGDLLSNETLAKELRKINCEIAVIPGNHDIDNPLAVSFSDSGYSFVEGITSGGWKEIYHDYGYDIAVSEDIYSCSYCISLNERYDMILIDDNGSNLTGKPLEEGGFITEGTFVWLKEQLERIKSEGKIPVVAMHHNLAIHFPSYYEGYTNDDYIKLSDLFSAYNVPFVLSGHMHLQSIGEIKGIYDIATSSLSITPLQYGIITLDNSSMSYHTKELDTDLDSEAFFIEANRERIENILGEDADEDEVYIIGMINAYYYSGRADRIKDDIPYSFLYQQFKESGRNDMVEYIEGMIRTPGKTSLEIDIKQ